MEAGALNVTEHDPSNPREVFRLLWRRKFILLFCILVIPAAAYLYSWQLPESYESTTLLQVQAIGDASDVVTGTTSGAAGNASVARLAETSGVADEAARLLGRPKGSLRGTVQAEADEDTGFITLTATAASAREAAAIVDAAAKALNSTREERGVERANKAIAGVQRDLSKLSRSADDATERQQLSEQLQRLRTLRAAQGSNAQVIEPATLPSEPVSPNPERNALLAFALAILLGIGLVILVDRMDRRLRDADEVEKLVDVPLLAVIPRDAFPGGRPNPRHALAFQTLRDSLTYFNVDQPLRTIAVTSPLIGEGKTTVATNLAVALARADRDVILVDADLRKPQVAVRMGVAEEPGLSSVLLGTRLEDALHEIPPFGSRLRVLPAGAKPPNPSELLGSNRMAALLDELSEIADVVVIDTTPLLVVSDAFPLLEKVSGTVALARLDQTPRAALQRMVDITTTAGGRVFGMVVTGAKGGGLRGHDYGYGYESAGPVVGEVIETPAGAAGAAPVSAATKDGGGISPALELGRRSTPNGARVPGATEDRVQPKREQSPKPALPDANDAETPAKTLQAPQPSPNDAQAPAPVATASTPSEEPAEPPGSEDAETATPIAFFEPQKEDSDGPWLDAAFARLDDLMNRGRKGR